MSFLTAGDHPVTIMKTMLADSTLCQTPGAMDACLFVQTEDGSQSDWYRFGINADFSRISNKNHMTNAAVSAEKLRELGFTGTCLSQLDTMVGIKTSAHVQGKQSNDGTKTFMNVKWLGGGGRTPQALTNTANVQQLSAMMFGGDAPAPGQQQQPAVQQQAQQPMQQQPMQQQMQQQPVAGGFQQQAQPQPAQGAPATNAQQPPVAGGFQQAAPNFNQ